jgi:AcrR family transcriptional regulator
MANEVGNEVGNEVATEMASNAVNLSVKAQPESRPRETIGSSAATKQRILDVAERLFVERGFTSTSLRMITTDAEVNLAAVNYHFGSKEGMIEEVLKRRLAPLNRERVVALDALEAQTTALPTVPEILKAYISAAVRLSRDPTEGGFLFLRLLGRAFTEPNEIVKRQMQLQYDEVARRYRRAFGKALPHLPEQELIWRMHFMFGAIAYAMAGTDIMQIVASCELKDINDFHALSERLVQFLAAGLQAPVPAI